MKIVESHTPISFGRKGNSMMPTIRAILLTVFFVSCLSAYGQTSQFPCGETRVQSIDCVGPNKCKQNVAVNLPIQAEYPVALGYFYVTCCESQIPSYYIYGSTCQVHSKLNDPVFLKELAIVADNKSLLIADCTGLYQPYRQPRNLDVGAWTLSTQRRKLLD